MRKIIVPFILLVLILPLCACSLTKKVEKKVTPEFIGPILSKDIIKKEKTAEPSGISNTFSTDELYIIASIKIKEISGDHKLRWEWIKPDGNLYYPEDYTIYTLPQKYHEELIVWHKLNINGEKAANYPGDWQVKVYVDGKPIGSKEFKIEGKPDLLALVKSQPQTPFNENLRALIIGIEKYSKAVPALFAERDAILMRWLFKRSFGVPEENIYTLINEKATLASIRDIVRDKLSLLTSNDTLYIYYSGHGFVKKLENDMGIPYILPHDGNPYNLEETAYTIDSLYTAIRESKAKNIYVFLDSCFSGNMTGRYKDITAIVPGEKGEIDIKEVIFDPLQLSQKAVSFTASKGNQISNSDSKEKYGLFTKHIVRAFLDKESPFMTSGKVNSRGAVWIC
jgi:hypothetical protein